MTNTDFIQKCREAVASPSAPVMALGRMTGAEGDAGYVASVRQISEPLCKHHEGLGTQPRVAGRTGRDADQRSRLTTPDDLERHVTHFGEAWRPLITDALTFLDAHEPTWRL